MKKRRTRFDYVLNEIKIMNALSTILKENGKKPTTAEIARESGLGKRTVIRHLRNYNDGKCIKDFKILTSKVIISLFEKAKEGRAPEVKLWMELVEKIKEEQSAAPEEEIPEKITFVLTPSQNQIPN